MNYTNMKSISATVALAKKYKGEQGLSAFEVAVQNGFEGTQEEWLESLKHNYSFTEEELAEIATHVPAYDDSAILARLDAVETKEDKDTVYDDSAIISRIVALENKEDKDTIYNDTQIRQLINNKQDKGNYALKSEIPNTYSKTEIDAKISAVEAGGVDLTNYYTRKNVDDMIKNVFDEVRDIVYKDTREIIENEVNALIDMRLGVIEDEVRDIVYKDTREIIENEVNALIDMRLGVIEDGTY